MYRQGDVLLVPCEKPTSVKIETLGEVVLAHGEATGHRHRFPVNRNVRAYRRGNDERFLRVVGRGHRLLHEEHDPIEVEPGWYEVVIQSEYDESEIRRVDD